MKAEFFEKLSDGDLSKLHGELCSYHERPHYISNNEVRNFILEPKPSGNVDTRVGRCIRLIEVNMVKRFKYKY